MKLGACSESASDCRKVRPAAHTLHPHRKNVPSFPPSEPTPLKMLRFSWTRPPKLVPLTKVWAHVPNLPAIAARCDPLSSEPSALNTEHETRNPKPEIRNPQPETPSPEPKAPNTKPCRKDQR